MNEDGIPMNVLNMKLIQKMPKTKIKIRMGTTLWKMSHRRDWSLVPNSSTCGSAGSKSIHTWILTYSTSIDSEDPHTAKTKSRINIKVLTYLLTELSPSWGAANCAAPQELPSILCNPKVQFRVHKSPPLVPILSRINIEVHTNK
jgi:hypothetical protein